MVDFLIIRNKCDRATEYTNEVGEGLKAYLEGAGHSVTDLSDENADPDQVKEWLDYDDQKTVKAVIALDHGSSDAFYGEEGGKPKAVIDVKNAERLTKKLHVYTLACSTNADSGLGETAVEKGCFSWLGYKVPVYAAKGPSFKECIWSYVRAMAEGKTLEECEEALREAYAARTGESPIYQYNLDRLLLRKSAVGMTINSHNRVTQEVAQYKVDGYAVRAWSSRPTTERSPGKGAAGIYLYEGDTYRGYAYFFADGTPLAPPVHDAVNGRVFLHLNLCQFDAVLEMLRAEEPIYVYYAGPTNAALRTGKEPVGEEEQDELVHA
jgi:hypothetical protein